VGVSLHVSLIGADVETTQPITGKAYWLVKDQACLETMLSSNPDVPNEVAIDACVKGLSRIIWKVLAESNPKCFQRDDPRSAMPPCF
jgi:hypothetical protein